MISLSHRIGVNSDHIVTSPSRLSHSNINGRQCVLQKVPKASYTSMSHVHVSLPTEMTRAVYHLGVLIQAIDALEWVYWLGNAARSREHSGPGNWPKAGMNWCRRVPESGIGYVYDCCNTYVLQVWAFSSQHRLKSWELHGRIGKVRCNCQARWLVLVCVMMKLSIHLWWCRREGVGCRLAQQRSSKWKRYCKGKNSKTACQHLGIVSLYFWPEHSEYHTNDKIEQIHQDN